MRMDVKLFTMKMSISRTNRDSFGAASGMKSDYDISKYSNKSAILFKKANARD